MKKFSLSLTFLPLVLFSPSAIAVPANNPPQLNAAQIEALSNLFCARLKNGERFDVAMFRAMADMAEKDENFSLLVANKASGFEIVGKEAVKACPAAVGQGMEKLSPRLREALFK
jgi:hypothetical protein